jgi:hypothetical protein
MQFKFINTPVIFFKKIYILKEYLNNFIIAYLDNIIIYLNSEEKYKEYIK